MDKQEAEARLKENLLNCMEEAALGGHDLGKWLPVAGRELAFQAVCRKCSKSVYASFRVVYSILEDTCTGKT